MKIVDRIFGWLLVLDGLLHAGGSVAAYRKTPVTLVWALSGTLAGLLVAGLNLLRVGRPHDRALARMSFAGCLGWLAVDLAFGKAFGNVLDVRVLTHAINAMVLGVMSLRTLARANTCGYGFSATIPLERGWNRCRGVESGYDRRK